MLRFIKWLITKISDENKKALLIHLMDDIVDGTTSSIDKVTAERLLVKIIKSVGNSISAFIVRD